MPDINKIPQKLFANTQKPVSIIGLGTTKFGRNRQVSYPGGENYALPSDQIIEEIFDISEQYGVNLIDTSPAYGTSEERIGKLLGKHKDRFFIVTKTGEEFDGSKSHYDFSADHTRLSIERSLRRLKVEQIGCVLVHCSRNDFHDLTENPVLEILAELKSESKIESFGASISSIEAAMFAIKHTDAIMVPYNIHDQQHTETIDAAKNAECTVLIKKGLASGHIDKIGSVQDSIRFVVNNPGVTSMVLGSINPQNVLNNLLSL